MTVALSQDFLRAFSNVQKSSQKKVREFCEKFQAHPESPGLNYEAIQSARDKNFFSVRIDKAYRAIVAKPDPHLYVLMWVDHHDEAYRWAERSQLKVHPATGALQILEVDASTAPTEAKPTKAGSLFKTVKDKHLLQFGVPEELLAVVRSMDSDADLERAEAMFPQEAYEALFLFASGYSVDEVFQQLDKPEIESTIDTADFKKALENEDSQRRFYVVEGAQEMSEIMARPLELWRIFLHPKQSKLVRMRANGPVRVLGGAGTGKTVTAMHRARYLAEEVFNRPDDRILLTTFTKNLATDISQNLRTLCTDEKAWARIEVRHLDGWVSNFLATQGFKPQVVFDGEDNAAWKAAMNEKPADVDVPDSFYRVEWESVVQAQNLTTLDEYLAASRIGRGTRLSRDAKRKVWTVFQAYRAELNQARKKEYVDLIRDARQVLENKGLKLPYRAVIVDEAQDMSAEALRLIRALAPRGENDIFIVGDAHQRIYRHRVSLGKCGIDIRGRGKKLKINYRTTDEIRRFAVKLLEGRPIDDLDSGQDDQKGYMSLTHGVAPEVRVFSSASDEIAFVSKYLKDAQAEGAPLESACVVARTNGLRDIYANGLRESGLTVYEISRNSSDQRDRPGVRLATMHRVKGLEFDHVIIVAANKGVVPLDPVLASADDKITERDRDTGERALLYVALTRAKKAAMITATGQPSSYLNTAVGR